MYRQAIVACFKAIFASMLPGNYPDFIRTEAGRRAKTLKVYEVKPKLSHMLSEEISIQMIKVFKKGIITTTLEVKHYIEVVTQLWTLFTDNHL